MTANLRTVCGMVTFHTTLWASGGNNVGIVVPEQVILAELRDVT